MTNYTDADQNHNIDGMFGGLTLVVMSVIIGAILAQNLVALVLFIGPAITESIGAFVALWYSWAYRRWFDNTSAEDF